MQLGILAPYNNLATSMAAALVPALLVPHQSKSDSKDKPSKFNWKKISIQFIIIIKYKYNSFTMIYSCQDNGSFRSS